MGREIVIIAGANGVGKTTFARAFLQEYRYEFLNADELAKSLSAENPVKKKISAGKLFLQKLNETVENPCLSKARLPDAIWKISLKARKSKIIKL
jgi:predicted ABC-type ATPase